MNNYPSYTTYAFENLLCTFQHPAMGKIDIQGQGTGSITFAMANDTSVHDLAADGSVMTSKMQAGNGTIVISCQQTMPIHHWLVRLHNYLMQAASSEWTRMSMMAISPDMRIQHTAKYISMQKRADKPYQAQGQQVSWTLLAASLAEVPL